MQFPATAHEDSSSASFIMRNSSSGCSQLFEFGVPQGSYLRVTPRVGLLTPQSSMRVQVDFSPPAAQQAATAAAGVAAPTAAGDRAAAAAAGIVAAATSWQQAHQQQQQQQPQEGRGALTASATGQYREWLLPCFLKQVPSPASGSSSSSSHAASTGQGAPSSSGGGDSGDAAGGGSSSSSSSADYVLHVSVTTCSISPEVLLVSPEMQKPSGKNYWVLDFGALPVGERCTLELLLQNTGACGTTRECTTNIIMPFEAATWCVGWHMMLTAGSTGHCAVH
jgi:hypothetical protein